jgi:hypothetical protein
MEQENSFALDLAASYACDRLGLQDYRNAKKDDLRAQLSKAYALTLDAYQKLFFESDTNFLYQEQNPAGGIKSSMMQACERVDADKQTAVTFEAWLQSGQSKLDKQTFEREELDRWMDENGIRELHSVKENLIQQTPEQRQTERWKLCESEGLLMPSNTYAQFPRGIGKVAKLLGIKPQSLRDDLNKYRARKFSK